jgi:hypothetical protein
VIEGGKGEGKMASENGKMLDPIPKSNVRRCSSDKIGAGSHRDIKVIVLGVFDALSGCGVVDDAVL